MGVYSDQVLPRIIDRTCGMRPLRPLRQRVCGGLTGRVLEVGFGSGLNVPYYPAGVDSVAAVEPSDVGWRLAGKRLARATVPVERSGLDGQALPFEDASFDSALTTWTLCTIRDVAHALGEVRRVLEPGGALHFQHGLAPEERVRRHQRRLEPLQRRLFGGCHLTRPISELVTAAGFEVVAVDTFYEKGAPKPLGAVYLGLAVAP